MLKAFLALTLLIGVHCIPLEEQLQAEQPQQPAVLQQEIPQQPEQAKPAEESIATRQDNLEPQPIDAQPAIPPVEGGALPPADLSGAPDANPVERSGEADLDTDATFGLGWGWGYRPYYRYNSYPSWGWRGYGWGGRSYNGGWRWGGRGWGGWGGRGWGNRYYW